MKIIKKTKKPNGRRHIYLCGIKIFSYKRLHKKQEKTKQNLFYLKIHGRLELDPTCKILEGCVLQNGPNFTIKIGKNSVINPYTVLYGGNIDIGNDVMIAPHVVITTANHNFKQLTKPMNIAGCIKESDIEIQDDVWIGANTTLAPGAHIGTGAVIGANSFVNSRIPDYAIAVGCPAKVIGSRLSYVKVKKNFKFSIIMPNLNGDKYLESSLKAFLEQSYLNKELIVVDSTSKDNSHKILEKYADGKTIKWIKEKDTSLSDAINIGIKHCTGDYIGYSGSDDFYINDILKIANVLLQENPVDCFYYDYLCYYPHENREIKYKIPYDFNRENLVKHLNFIGLEDIFFARKLLEEFKYNEAYKYAMDYEIYLNILSHRPNLKSLHIPVYGTRNILDGNISTTYARAGEEESNRAALKYVQTDEEKELVIKRMRK